MTKTKILNLLLIISSLLGYLEWNGSNHIFLFQVEAEIFSKLFASPVSALHPFIILPLLGQISLFATLFQKTPSKALYYIGISGIGLLIGLMFIIGLMSTNIKILCSTLPFVIVCCFAIKHNLKTKSNHR
jgi:hypothetical protein